MDVTLRRLKPCFELEIPDEHLSLTVERIGKGRFTTAYRANECTVYLVVNKDAGDYSKHILSNCDGPYIPELERVGHTKAGHTVWRTRYYQRLRADHKAAWAEYKRLKNVWLPLHWSAGHEYGRGLRIMDGTIDKLDPDHPLTKALQQIRDECTNYGLSYTFEFAPRNLGVDTAGHLILLDPIFDLETIQRGIVARRKRISNRW
jgi:hypothetical protein